jgi:hypothetical protein
MKNGKGYVSMSQSEVAQLKAQIMAEYEAGKRGLIGLAEGTAQHQFITSKMENMCKYLQRLIELAGPEKARAILLEEEL